MGTVGLLGLTMALAVSIAPASVPAPTEATTDGAATPLPAIAAGAGWEAANATANLSPPASPSATNPPAKQAQPSPVLPRAGIKPVSTWEAVRHTPRARAAAIGIAAAATSAMMIYGVMSMVDQRRQIRAAPAAQLPKFTPYPR